LVAGFQEKLKIKSCFLSKKVKIKLKNQQKKKGLKK
jgi:hypothetical protein